MILSGCATLAEKEKAEALEEITTKYGRAIRFGYMELAKIFLRSPESMQKDYMVNVTGIKVTSYEVVNKALSTDKLEAQQVVEIQYYYTDKLIEKTLHDVQIWKYDVSEEKWYLHSGLPDFK
jgi:guanylate kinase